MFRKEAENGKCNNLVRLKRRYKAISGTILKSTLIRVTLTGFESQWRDRTRQSITNYEKLKYFD